MPCSEGAAEPLAWSSTATDCEAGDVGGGGVSRSIGGRRGRASERRRDARAGKTRHAVGPRGRVGVHRERRLAHRAGGRRGDRAAQQRDRHLTQQLGKRRPPVGHRHEHAAEGVAAPGGAGPAAGPHEQGRVLVKVVLFEDFGHPYRLNERKKPYHHRRKKLLERKNLTLAKVSGHLEKSNSRALNRRIIIRQINKEVKDEKCLG